MFEALFGEDKGLSALLEPGGDGGPKVGPRPTPKPDGKAKDGAADPKQAGVAMAFWADHPEEALKQLPPEKRMEAIYQLPEDQRGRAQEAMVELQQKEIASRERQEALARLGEDEDAHEAHEGAVKALSEASPEEREQLLGDLPPEKRALAEEAAAEARAREEAEVEADKKKSEEKERLSALAEEKAAEIAKLAASAGKKEGWEDKYSIGGAVDFEKENLDAAIKELPAEIRGEVLKKLQARAEGEDAELSGEALGLAKESIDALNAKEAQEKRWKEMEEKSISTGVSEAEKAVGDESGKQMKSALKEMSLSEEKKALERMTPEARAAAEDAIAKRREKLTKAAETLSKAREGKGLTDGTDEGAIFKTLAGLTPKEAEELQEIYGELYKDEEGKPRRLKHDLYDELDEDGEKADRDYVRAVLDGDDDAKELGVEAAVRYIENEVDALLDTDESGINDLLRAHCTDQAAMDRIAEAYQKKTGKSLDKELKAVMDSDEYKEASAYERGDKRSANVAVIEGGDPERADQVVDEVSEEPGGMKELCQDVQNHTGMKPSEALKGAVSEEKMAEVEAEVKSAELENEAKRDEKLKAGLAELEKDPAKLADANIRMEKLASKLAGQLSNMHVVGNNFDVTNLIADLGAGEVALLQQHFKAHSLDGKGDLETALREKLSGKDLKVANAVMSGDNVLVAVARVEQAADGTGTDVDAWRKAMEALTDPKDRERFKELMDQHVGGVKGSGYADTVKGDLSSHDRDEMEALAIEDENERVGTLAAVRASKNAYGGKWATTMEGLGDTLSDTFRPDETPEERAERRAQARKDPLTWLSNAGGGEEGILDAVETLENPEQIAAFEAKMKGLNRESAAETMEAELSTHKLDASKRFLAGDYEGGLSQRMMASADGWIDDDEKGISAGFGKVRLTADEKKEIANLPKDQQAAAQEAMLKAARQRLEGRADEDAKAAGKGSYAEIVESELDEDQKKAERDMRESGQVSEVNQLLEAGNTTLGLGKEAGKFYEILQKKSPKQIDDLAAKFEAENPGLKFKDWVMSKATSAGEKRDFAILVEGNYARMPPEELDALAKDNPEKLIERVKALHEAARAGKDGLDAYNPKAILGNLAGNAMTDAVSGTGATVDARLEKVQALEKKIQGGEKLSDEEREELVKHMRYMAGDQEAFTEAKTATTGVVATVLNKAANVTVTALTGVPELGELAGALAEYDAKDSLNGGRFSADDKISLVIRAGANYGLSKLGLSGGAEGALGGVVDAVADPKKWRDLGQLGTAALENAGTGLITGTIGELGNKAGGDGPLGEVLSSGGTAAANYDPNKSGWDQTKDLGVDLATGLAKNKAKAHHDAKHRPADDGPDARHAEPDRTPVKEPDAGPTPAPAEVKDVDATPAPAAKRDTDEPAKRAETEAAPPVSPEAKRAMDAAAKLFDPAKALGKDKEEFHDGVEETYRHPNEELSPAQQTMRQMAEGNANQEGDCTKDSEATRRALAEAGVDATVMNFEPQGGDADAIGHRYVVAPGGVVIDPTFSQMMKPPPGWDPKQPLPSGKLWFEPFSGSYGDMKARVQEAIDHGFMPDVPKGTSAEEVIRKNWGIEPGADGALKFGKDVKPRTEADEQGGGMKPPDGGPPSSHEEETSARPPDARAELIAKQTAELIEAGIPPETARAMAETNVDADLRQREKDLKPPVEVNEPTKDELAEVETALDEERTPEVHSDEASDAERKDVEAALEEEHRREAEAEAEAKTETKTETTAETKAEAKDAEKPKSLGERIKEGFGKVLNAIDEHIFSPNNTAANKAGESGHSPDGLPDAVKKAGDALTFLGGVKKTAEAWVKGKRASDKAVGEALLKTVGALLPVLAELVIKGRGDVAGQVGKIIDGVERTGDENLPGGTATAVGKVVQDFMELLGILKKPSKSEEAETSADGPGGGDLEGDASADATAEAKAKAEAEASREEDPAPREAKAKAKAEAEVEKETPAPVERDAEVERQTAELIEAGIPPATARAMAETNVQADRNQREKSYPRPTDVDEAKREAPPVEQSRAPEIETRKVNDDEAAEVEKAVLDEEIDRQAAELEAQGVPPDVARQRAKENVMSEPTPQPGERTRIEVKPETVRRSTDEADAETERAQLEEAEAEAEAEGRPPQRSAEEVSAKKSEAEHDDVVTELADRPPPPKVDTEAEARQRPLREKCEKIQQQLMKDPTLAALAAERRRLREMDGRDGTYATEAEWQDLERRTRDAAVHHGELDPTTELLVKGFTPKEIAAHFDARSYDADSTMKGPRKDGAQVNSDGTVRPASTDEQRQRALDISGELLADRGPELRKAVPENTAKQYREGTRDFVGGDVGDPRNTNGPDRAATEDTLRVLGLDYPGSPFVTDDGRAWKPAAQDGGVQTIQGTMSDKLQAQVAVPLGHDMHQQARDTADRLEAEQARRTEEREKHEREHPGEPVPPELQPIHIPEMYRKGPSTVEDDPKRPAATTMLDEYPRIMERTRDQEDDTKSGGGYSTTERMGLPTEPNLELTSKSATIDQPTRVSKTNADGKSTPLVHLVPGPGGKLVPQMSLDPSQHPEAYREFVKQTAGDKDTSPDQKATRHKLLESIGDYPEEIARAELEETQRQEVVQRALKYQAQGMSWKEAHERARLDVIEEAAVDPASPLKDKLDRFDGLLS